MATPNVSVADINGVPPVAFARGFGGAISLLSADVSPLPSAPAGAAQWGLFLGGAPVIVAESVVGLEFRKESLIADYPVEQGAFASYNKVKAPFDVRLRFASGKDPAARAALIASIDAIADDLNLYDAVTPEKVYTNVNVAHHDYHRAARNGVGLLVADVWCLQIQVVAAAAMANTAQPSGAATVNGGPQQAIDASPAHVAALNAGGAASTAYSP